MPALTKEHDQKDTTLRKDMDNGCRTASDLGAGNCSITIRIEHVDAINIHNCSTPEQVRQPDAQTPAIGTSDCIPLIEGHKPKQDFEARTSSLLANNRVPSALAATFFHQARRFLQGFEPANDLERQNFAILADLPGSMRGTLQCALDRYATTPQKHRLFSPEIDQLGTDPLTIDLLASALARELIQRASIAAFDDPSCFETERPGLLRRPPSSGNDDVGSPLVINISSVNDLRTNNYVPQLSLGEYRVEEVQQICNPEIHNDSVVQNCAPQQASCPGNMAGDICLRVPEVMPGDAVILQGFNYFSVDGRVRLEASAPGTVVREVDALVCGDITTGLTETVNGTERLIRDSRVHDRLLFTVPEDLPEGVYGIRVIMPLEGNDIISPSQQFIRVLAPVTTTYQIASEELKAIAETSPGWLGSDEVGIKVLATAITADAELGPLSSHDFRFGGLDSGDVRDMSRVLFQQSNVAGAVIAMVGHEIDNDELYEDEVQDWSDAFVALIGSSWDAVAGALGASGVTIAALLGAAATAAAAIGSLVTTALHILGATVLRADLIIEDTISLGALDLAARTNINFPAPDAVSYTPSEGIHVTAEALSKDVQYREKRGYDAPDEGSRYSITLRYNRVQAS
ncbi:MAG: hypothetical protein JXA93_13885 [Anaerolineae bacterium]|nr:hypothetical protein [Anaerolineae bacterium]